MNRPLIAGVVTAVSVTLFAVTAAGSLTERGFGLTTAPSDSCALVVMSSAAAQPALHAGDRIDTRRLGMHERLHLMVTGSSDRMDVPAIVAGRRQMVTIAPMATAAPQPAAGLRIAALAALLAIGLWALWRGRDAASLGLGLFFAAVPSLFLHHAYPGLPDLAIIAVLFLSALVGTLGYLGLYGMIETLAADSPARRWFALARAIVVAALGLVAVTSIASLSTQIFAGCTPIAQLRIVVACYAIVLAVGFTVLWIGMHGASPTHRRRLRWIFWSTVLGYAGPLVTYAFVAAQRPIPLDGAYNVAFLAIPIGYSYAVLRHRVIDVGFVLNRALAYTLLPSVVVGAFTLTETIAAGAALGNTESTLLKLAVPLAIGLSFNALHKRLERAIDALFFRRRREAETALTAFAHEAAHFETRGALAERTVEEVVRWGGVLGAAIYQRDGETYARTAYAGRVDGTAELGRDDPALVALRTTRRPADLDRGYAFGLFSSGRLDGALVVLPRESGEAFTPDEIALFDSVAKQVAAGLAGLRLAEYARFVEALATGDTAEPIRSRAAAIVHGAQETR
jgi:hypothetical protein